MESFNKNYSFKLILRKITNSFNILMSDKNIKNKII